MYWVMEKNEFAVLAELRRNSREHFSSISRRTGISLSTVCDIASRLTSIRRDVALLKLDKVGFPLRIFLAVSARPGKEEALRSLLESSACINTLSALQGDFDYFIDAFFMSFEPLQRFLDEVSDLAGKKKVYYVLGPEKVEGMLTRKSDYPLLREDL